MFEFAARCVTEAMPTMAVTQLPRRTSSFFQSFYPMGSSR